MCCTVFPPFSFTERYCAVFVLFLNVWENLVVKPSGPRVFFIGWFLAMDSIYFQAILLFLFRLLLKKQNKTKQTEWLPNRLPNNEINFSQFWPGLVNPRSRWQHGDGLLRTLFLVHNWSFLTVSTHGGRCKELLWHLFYKSTNPINEVSILMT